VAQGSLITVVLTVLGIGFIGALTATITTFFLRPVNATEQGKRIKERLTRIEDKLDGLLEERNRRP
jgi:hypothetical protein